MLSNLQSLFKKQFQLTHVAALLNHLSNVVSICQKDCLVKEDGKDEALDSVCEILKSYKDDQTKTDNATSEEQPEEQPTQQELELEVTPTEEQPEKQQEEQPTQQEEQPTQQELHPKTTAPELETHQNPFDAQRKPKQ